ncbi:DUF6538 domain-containing protein [Mesorhizobium sp. M0129]|uniref:DUF6538 domain-containing protein n=1 Tax=Mesorhizobium sp. M0129 TaxID=2956886 RepID=UPI003336F1A3
MGRNRTRTDPDRYLTIRQGNYHYKRRVPVTIAHLDERAPHVRASLKTDDRGLARSKRDLLEAADDALSKASLTLVSGTSTAPSSGSAIRSSWPLASTWRMRSMRSLKASGSSK